MQQDEAEEEQEEEGRRRRTEDQKDKIREPLTEVRELYYYIVEEYGKNKMFRKSRTRRKTCTRECRRNMTDATNTGYKDSRK